MLLRNGKRKLNLNEEPPTKRIKLSPSKKKSLYINDINTPDTELQMLRNVGPETSQKIFEESREGPFKSKQDLVNRVRGITTKSIDDSAVNLIFKTRFEEQAESIYDALIDIPWINSICDEKYILRIIAENCVGIVATCDNEKCDESILMANHDEIYNFPDIPFLQDAQSYLFCEDPTPSFYSPNNVEAKFYYYRKSEYLTNYLICDKCFDELAHCEICFDKIYFDNDKSTYNICPGTHVYIEENDGIETRRVVFNFRMCKDCSSCTVHTVDRNAVRSHRLEDWIEF